MIRVWQIYLKITFEFLVDIIIIYANLDTLINADNTRWKSELIITNPSVVDWGCLSIGLDTIQTISWAFRYFLGILIQLSSITMQNDISNGSSSSSLIIFAQWLPSSLNFIFEILFLCLKIAAILLIFYFAYLLRQKIYEEGVMVILPFETPGEEVSGKYKGKAISDLLIGELQRIRKFEAFPIRYPANGFRDLGIPDSIPRDRKNSGHNGMRRMGGATGSGAKYFPSDSSDEFVGIPSLGQELSSFRPIVPPSETLEYGGISGIGTIGAARTSLSLGKMIVVFKRLCPGSCPTAIITGSMQIYGSFIIITACLEDREVRAWEVKRKIKNRKKIPEEYIPSMIRDLAFKIAHDLAKEDSKI